MAQTISTKVALLMDGEEFFMANPASWWAKVTPFSSGLGDTDNGVIFPGHCQNKGKKGEKKKFCV